MVIRSLVTVRLVIKGTLTNNTTGMLFKVLSYHHSAVYSNVSNTPMDVLLRIFMKVANCDYHEEPEIIRRKE